MSRKTTFEDHLQIIEAGHQKTAGAKGGAKIQSSLLDKLAEELGAMGGETIPDNTTVVGADPAVQGAMDSVIIPQSVLAGGDPAEVAAGEVPAAATPTDPNLVISDGDGSATDANNLNRTPEAVAAAAGEGGGDESGVAALEGAAESEAIDAQAADIGEKIACAFQETLSKQAEDQLYTEALGILKEAGVLEGYDIHDMGLEKTAELEENYLEKIANRQQLTRTDIIGAATQVVEFEKQASIAEEMGRNDAREIVATLAQNAENVTALEKQASDEQAAVNNLLQDPAVVNAVNVLKSKGVI